MAELRIIGGRWRSRRIKVLMAKSLRPTPDRIRETLFNWLGQDLSGLSCLDLFAGSGALGFEAASRGAHSVVLVEKAKNVYDQLRAQALSFADPTINTIHTDALQFLKWAKKNDQKFDLLFLDPPFRQGWLEELLPLITPILHPGARLYVESEHLIQEKGCWKLLREGQAGQVFFQLFFAKQIEA